MCFRPARTYGEHRRWTRSSPPSCASSPTPRNTTPPARRPARRSAAAARTGLGSTTGAGICHAYTPDGRCVSLLKILLTNWCLYDCAYCVNRRSSNTAARAVHGRGSGDADDRVLQAQLYRGAVPVLRHRALARPHDGGDDARRAHASPRPRLRRLHPSEGDPGGEPVADRAGGPLGRPAFDQPRAADRRRASRGSRRRSARRRSAPRWARCASASTEARRERRRFAPAGQSTQVIVGADDTTDAAVLAASARLYDEFRLRRVYYSAFSPIPEPSPVLPAQAAAAAAREPALPGRLAAALLRLRCRRDRRGRRRAACSTSRPTRSSPGR